MTVYLISPDEDLAVICASDKEAQRYIADHIGLHSVTCQEYKWACKQLDNAKERVFTQKATYRRWQKEVQP